MSAEKLEQVVRLAAKAGHVLVATADGEGMPHVAAAGRLELAAGERVAVREWFCPGTVANLRANKCVSVVVWDRESDSGYQLAGRLEEIEDVGVMDGYAPELEGERPLPQVEERLVIAVERILEFRQAPHSDVAE
jgi:hypothetical protein